MMTATEVRQRRAEADARLKSDLHAYERALLDHREDIRELREQCPHEHKRLDAAQYVYEFVCEDCGAVLSN
jgi:hypothetical protein